MIDFVLVLERLFVLCGFGLVAHHRLIHPLRSYVIEFVKVLRLLLCLLLDVVLLADLVIVSGLGLEVLLSVAFLFLILLLLLLLVLLVCLLSGIILGVLLILMQVD